MHTQDIFIDASSDAVDVPNVVLPLDDHAVASESALVPVSTLRNLIKTDSPRKAPLLRRAAANMIDRLLPLPFLVPLFWPWVVVPLLYDLFRDSRGASVGKRLMGLQAVIVSPRQPGRNGQPCTVGRSLLRNSPYALARLCYLSGILAPIGIAYDLIEVLLAVFSPSGRRLGDLLGGTRVTASEAASANAEQGGYR